MTDASTSLHRRAWDLIPWIINGSAPQSECQAVEAHLHDCPDCGAELEFQRRVQMAIARKGTPDLDPHASWQRLSARLDAGADAELPSRLDHRHPSRFGRAWMPWVMAAMLVQAIALGALGAALWWRTAPGDSNAIARTGAYRTLSAAASPAPQATIRAVFAPTMTLGELQALLAGARLRVVTAPSDGDVWSLGPADDSTRAATDTAVQALRAHAAVRFAEPIGASP